MFSATFPTATMADVTLMLTRAREGDPAALGEIVSGLYAELRAVASRQRRWNGAAETVNTTALVHEAYAKLAGQERLDLTDREHFVRVAARAMRDVIVDHARAQNALKRGGSGRTPSLDGLKDAGVQVAAPEVDLDEALSVDAALDRLAALDPEAARIAELRYFTGLSNEETAAALGVSLATAKRRWAAGRAWLARELAVT